MQHKFVPYCYFLHFSVDATFAHGLGRLVNDSPQKDANCVMKRVVIDNVPHLLLYAKDDIQPGDELRYNYGIKGLPWRKSKGMFY